MTENSTPTGEEAAVELLGRMHLDAIANGDWESAADLATALEAKGVAVDGTQS